MLEVIGAGLGRTGTHSLAEALEVLGLGPCYTILDVDKNHHHLDLWMDAMGNEEVDWQRLYRGYRSAVEWPTVSFLPSILHQFPECQFVLTLRDAESWYESASATIFSGLEASARHPDSKQRSRGEMKRTLILEKMFDGRYREKDHAIEVYENHNKSVVDLVPKERLLQYEIVEGWRPLCQFLHKPVPAQQFPHRNQRSAFLESAPDWAKDHLDGRGASLRGG